MFNVQKRTTTQAANTWVKIQLCGKSFARKRERHVGHNRVSERAGFFLQRNINSNNLTNNCLALVQMQLTAVQCMRARRLRECSRQWAIAYDVIWNSSIAYLPTRDFFPLHCIAFYFIYCLVSYCFVVQCIIVCLAFWFSAFRSYKFNKQNLNLNLIPESSAADCSPLASCGGYKHAAVVTTSELATTCRVSACFLNRLSSSCLLGIH